MNKTVILLLMLVSIALISPLKSISQTKSFDEPIEYNDYIIGLQNEIGVEIQAFISAVTNDGKSDALASLNNLIAVIDKKITDLSNLSDFEGNTEFRDAGLELFKFYKSIAVNEYKEFVEIKFKEIADDDDNTKLEEIVKRIQENEKEYDEVFLNA